MNERELRATKEEHTGHCYVIGFRGGITKIGVSKSPKKRIRQLSNSGLVVKDVFVSERCRNYYEIEQCLLEKFSHQRINGEYVKVGFSTVVDALLDIQLTHYTVDELRHIHEQEKIDAEKFRRTYESMIGAAQASFHEGCLTPSQRTFLFEEAEKISYSFENIIDAIMFADKLHSSLCLKFKVNAVDKILATDFYPPRRKTPSFRSGI